MITAEHHLRIFIGQGVKHPLGYGAVKYIAEKRIKIGITRNSNPIFKFVPDYTKVFVKFESGAVVICDRENLSVTPMPDYELARLRAKWGIGEQFILEEAA